VRLVSGARRVVQHLDALAVAHRPVDQPGNARLDARDQLVFAALENMPWLVRSAKMESDPNSLPVKSS
jgi:hypothetical protein